MRMKILRTSKCWLTWKKKSDGENTFPCRKSFWNTFKCKIEKKKKLLSDNNLIGKRNMQFVILDSIHHTTDLRSQKYIILSCIIRLTLISRIFSESIGSNLLLIKLLCICKSVITIKSVRQFGTFYKIGSWCMK